MLLYLPCETAFSVLRQANGRRRMMGEAVTEILGEVNTDYFVRSTERFERGGYLGALELMDREKMPRAIICAYDRLATGAMRAFADRGLKVPEDIAVVGIDDAPASGYSTPSLSSISHEIESTCRAVADALFKKIKGEDFESDINIVCKLNRRESSVIKT